LYIYNKKKRIAAKTGHQIPIGTATAHNYMEISPVTDFAPEVHHTLYGVYVKLIK